MNSTYNHALTFGLQLFTAEEATEFAAYVQRKANRGSRRTLRDHAYAFAAWHINTTYFACAS